ncbi:MAG: InlB B-repeat-containing protein [Paludibacteraceae bacterium]|nr:InlB B-repeat-containing protein [Paludibacteraceae bacterium]
MKKFLITAFTLLISLGVMAQATNDRTLRLYYGGEVIFSRLVSQLDSLNFKVNTIEDEEEDKPVVPDISTCDKNYSESGLYLGIIGFNNKLTEKELGILNPSTVNSYKTFVNNLSVGNATVLYYAEENGLDRLTQASFPSDLISASIVTFTDGLDQGSVAYNEYYENMGIAQYLTDLNGRILSEKVCGSNIKIDAYAIGLQGKDVQDVDAFKNNLKKLSSSEDKMFEANDMDEVNETFNNIARSLYSATSIFSMTFNIPMPSNGEVIRFTFDNVEKAEDSKCYIEGTYRSRNLEDLKFEGCLYQGPAVISGVKSGVEMSFSFEGLSDTNNEQLPRTNIQNFKKSSVNGIWQLNSEFDGNSNVEIEEEQKTAVVMLVLDCSSSLGDDFARMKSAANNFISLLLNASEQNNTVSFDANGGSGSMSSMTFGKGETKTLTANTFTRTGYTFTGWNTKSDGSGTSYTNKQSITPTENLTLYAQWEESKDTGTANGHEWVDLGLPSGTKWATTNVGATTPEGYGNYYAWGETQPKATYTLDNYKWYDSETETYTKYPKAKRNVVLPGSEQGRKSLTFNVTVPYGTHVCYIVGSPSWEHLKMQKVDDTHFTLTTDELDGLEYKYCAGDTWTFVEKLANGAHPADREYAESDVVVAWNAIQDPEITIILELEDDAANANWGGDWHIPSKEEMEELIDNCTWTSTTQNGVKGYKVTSKTNGNSIFLPAAGEKVGNNLQGEGVVGFYWSSSLDTSISDYAYEFGIYIDKFEGDSIYRYYGHSVRAVLR